MAGNSSVKKSLGALVVIGLVALVAVTAAGIMGLRHAGEMLTEVGKNRLPALLGLEILNEGLTAIRSENRRAGALAGQTGRMNEINTVLKNREAVWARIDKGWKIYEPLPKTTNEEALWKQFVQEWGAWKTTESKVQAAMESMANANTEEDGIAAKQEYVAGVTGAKPPFDKTVATLGMIIDLNMKIAAEVDLEATTSSRRAMIVMVVTSAAALLALLIFGMRISNAILQTLGGEPGEVRAMVKLIANGDLRHNLNVKAGDTESLMANQQRMQVNLRTLVTNIVSTVDRTEEASHALAGAAQQVAVSSAGTSESAASMAASVEQMSVSIGQVSDNTRSALSTVERAGQLSVQGGRVIEEAIAEINNIAAVVRSTAVNMGSLSESSNRISSVVQVIKDVADQTNLLALNAAIEAARAGETGRGFAVVADEVRKLAERTAAATNEISAMITQIQQETHASVTTMEAAVEQVDRGVELASQAGTAIHEIRDSVRQVVGVVNDIGSAIDEQSAASQQISQRVESVAQASEENNAAAQQTAEAAKELTSLASQLRSTVSRFEV